MFALNRTSRRKFMSLFGIGAGGLAVMAVTGCDSTENANGTTTYSFDVDSFSTGVSDLCTGLKTLVASSSVLGVLSPTQISTLTGLVNKAQDLVTTVGGYIGSTVTLTVAKSWLTTAENIINELATLMSAVSSLLPTNVVTYLTYVKAILPILEALVNTATGTTSMKKANLGAAAATLPLPKITAVIAAGL